MNQKQGSGGGNVVLTIVAILLVLLVLGAIACGGLFIVGVRSAQSTVIQAKSKMEAEMQQAVAEAERQQAMAEQAADAAQAAEAADQEEAVGETGEVLVGVLVAVLRDDEPTLAEVVELLPDSTVRIRWLDREADAEDATAVVTRDEVTVKPATDEKDAAETGESNETDSTDVEP